MSLHRLSPLRVAEAELQKNRNPAGLLAAESTKATMNLVDKHNVSENADHGKYEESEDQSARVFAKKDASVRADSKTEPQSRQDEARRGHPTADPGNSLPSPHERRQVSVEHCG